MDVEAVRCELSVRVLPELRPKLELQDYLTQRIPPFDPLAHADDWASFADGLRQRVLEQVVLRGVPDEWLSVERAVVWGATLETSHGYRIRKLRFEAVPGLWIPALLYEPTLADAQVPAVLNVNGHVGPIGKAIDYKQLRCINLAKRGLLALNLEWLFYGELQGEMYAHNRSGYLDLVGVAGVAVFYLAMQRGLEILLRHPHTDVERVAVTGLSGGGWQTIVLSALDTRVRLATPVAGYIGLEQRVQWHNDIGDLEQNPTDLVRFADYTWLTALLAPRPALLVYNDKDDCCFQSKRARASVYEPVAPLYQALGVRERFAFHSNADPGTHNYELDNRQQFYRFLNEQGYWVGQRMEDELPSQAELRTAEELTVGLPQPNADFCSLALMCARGGPRLRVRARSRAGALRWQARARQELAGLVRYTAPMLSAERLGAVEISGMTAIRWVLHTSDGLSLPAVELTPTGVQCTETVVAACDAGRDALQGTIEHVLARRQRVLAVDVLLTGELRIADARPGHYPMMLATVGECPLGLQAGQLCAATRWAEASYGAPVALVGQGRAMGLAALVAAALGAPAARVAALEVPISLRLLIERGVHYDACPTVFAFGLLDGLDVRELVALALPRDVALVRPEGAPARVHRELAPLGRVAAWLGGSVKVLDGAAASGY